MYALEDTVSPEPILHLLNALAAVSGPIIYKLDCLIVMRPMSIKFLQRGFSPSLCYLVKVERTLTVWTCRHQSLIPR